MLEIWLDPLDKPLPREPDFMIVANQMKIFDGSLIRQRRDRASKDFASHDILFRETAEHLIERLKDVKRDLRQPLLLGMGDPLLEAYLTGKGLEVRVVDFTPQETLPLVAGSFDLILSNLNLHWINDLPGALIQIQRLLRPGGLFLGAVAGGSTLHELRTCLIEAELAVRAGVSARLSPMIELTSASALLERAGFELPVVDDEAWTFHYSSAKALMKDLRGMGQTNALIGRERHFTRREVFQRLEELYKDRFGVQDMIPATFEVLFLHGWKSELSTDRR